MLSQSNPYNPYNNKNHTMMMLPGYGGSLPQLKFSQQKFGHPLQYNSYYNQLKPFRNISTEDDTAITSSVDDTTFTKSPNNIKASKPVLVSKNNNTTIK